MTWEPELEEKERREALARELGWPERVARQRASGRRTVRERIDALFDAGTFVETGSLAGRRDLRRRPDRRRVGQARALRRPLRPVPAAGGQPRRPARLRDRDGRRAGGGGLEAAYRRELEAAEDPVAARAEIEGRLNAVRSPFRTAERFGIEEIIDPRDTRPRLCAWARRAHALVAHESGDGPKRRTMRP